MTPTGKLPADLQALLEETTAAFSESVSNFCGGWDKAAAALAHEGFRQAVRLANAGHLMHLEADPAYPLLVKMQSLQRQMMLPSVDAVYHGASLHSDYSYRLTGNRGSAFLFQVAIYRGSSSRYPDFKLTFDRDNLSGQGYAPGETLDLVLDSKPRPELGDRWIPLPDGGCELHIRQYYLDWSSEEPAYLMIEREHPVYPPPALDTADIPRRLEAMGSWQRVQSALARQYVESFLQSDSDHMKAITIPGAFEGTRYLNGHYRCGVDEAVILEVEAPDAKYWGFQLSNLAWEALDYYRRQTSLNASQAVLDGDGVFRAVICHQDPGVANWLDAGGRELGLISGRYFKSGTAPEPRLRTVPLETLWDNLPRTTATVTKEKRTESLRERWHSVHRRLCSDQ